MNNSKLFSLENIVLACISLALMALTFTGSLHFINNTIGPIPLEGAVVLALFVAIPLIIVEHAVWELLTLQLHDRSVATRSLPGDTVEEQVLA